MSDPLAEALAPILEQHAYDPEYGECSCGWPDPPEAAKDSEEWSDHAAPIVADAARAFIGDEIAKEQKRVLGLATEHDDYVAADAMEDAEQIARGDTK